MKTTDIILFAGVALVVVVVGKKLLATPSASPSSGGVDPTLGGVAGIIGATGGLLDSIKGLVRGEPKPPEESKTQGATIPPLGRMSIDKLDEQLNFRGEAAIPRSGFAVTA